MAMPKPLQFATDTDATPHASQPASRVAKRGAMRCGTDRVEATARDRLALATVSGDQRWKAQPLPRRIGMILPVSGYPLEPTR